MITVLFATHNGEKTLPIMLDAFCRLEIPEDGWEIIVVDNASSDQSANIIKSYSDKLPINYLYEQKPGKNNALNLGLSYAKGDLIVFTDDDIIPQQDWLVQLVKCAHNHLDYSVFGGVIKPYWPREPEDWILNHVPLGVTYALTEDGRVEGEIFPGLVWGANMSIRRTVFDSGYYFDDTVGPNGKNYVMGSETEFTIRLGKAGYKSWFCKSAVVQHIIRDNQLEPEWIVNRAYRFGRNMYRQEYKYFDSKIPFLFGIPRWMFAKLLQQYNCYVMALVQGDVTKKWVALWEIQFIKGYFYESRVFNK
ncbi:MAG: glycosyltransferase [Methylobacter sp.]|nr:glycosyltransferase [Methylobacter sp.]